GSVQIVPADGYNTPHAQVLLNHRTGGILTMMTTVEGQLPGAALRMYADSIGEFNYAIAGSTNAGLALANPSGVPATVQLEIRRLDGSVLRLSQPFLVPANGQVSMFLSGAPGFETLTGPFEGILRVVSKSPQGITATSFRTLYNERGNLLYTTTGPLTENAGTPTQLIFPHIAEGGGYTTQFIVVGGASGQGNSGTLQFFTQEGNPL